MNNKFLPTENSCRRGFYPVCNAKEWEELPMVYKAMDWFPIEVNRLGYDGKFRKDTTVVEEVVFNVTYLEPYKVSAKVSVHRQNVQSILFCGHSDAQCMLYEVCEVKFANGETAGAKWMQDSITGAFEIISYGKVVGIQGGFLGYIPEIISETEDGFTYNQNYYNQRSSIISHLEMLNPFK